MFADINVCDLTLPNAFARLWKAGHTAKAMRLFNWYATYGCMVVTSEGGQWFPLVMRAERYLYSLPTYIANTATIVKH